MAGPKAQLYIYTDGACLGNPGPGGYGVVMRYGDHAKELQGSYRRTTNNRMELLAVIVALEALKKKQHGILIYSDSRYVVNAVEKGWLANWLKTNFKGKKNPDLWKRFWKLYQTYEPRLHWIKGHAGHKENERCDELAVAAAHQGPWQIDQVYETLDPHDGPS